MTRDPRADEMLREILADMTEDDPLASEIRAYLAEPQSKVEYVWRIAARGTIATPPLISDPSSEAAARDWQKALARSIEAHIERAQIGPWERVDA